MGEMRHTNPSHPVSVRDFRQAHELFQGLTQKAYETLEKILDNEAGDPAHRIAAAKEVLNRAYGQAPSMQIIQGLVEHKHKFTVPQEILERMDPAKLAHLESALSGLIEEAEVVEHESDQD